MDSSQGYESDSTIVADPEFGGAAKKKPFPAVQLTIICLTQFAEPVASSVIYPFMTSLVWHTGIARGDETKIGYFAGAIESAFFFAECLSVLQWSRLADCIGRRPVLLLGTFGVSLTIFSLGMSRNYWIVLAARCMQGIFNGAISGVGKSMIIEITDASDVPKAFGWIPAVWCAGITLGPVIGGTLSDPATKWPEALGRFKYLANYPYFLPCAVVASAAFFTFMCAWCLLRESLILPPHTGMQAIGKGRLSRCKLESTPLLRKGGMKLKSYSNASCDSASAEGVREHLGREDGLCSLLSRPLLVPLINYAFTSFLDQSFLVLIALVFSTSIAQGGLALDPFSIGLLMGGWGAFNSLFQIIAFMRVMRWLGPRWMHILCFSCFLLTFLGFPAMSYFAKRAGAIDWRVVCVLVLQMSCLCIVYMSYACSQLFLLDATPNDVSLARVNGLAQTASTLARGIAPTFASSLFSVSLQEHLMGGYMVYAVLTGTTFIGIYMATKSPLLLKMQKY